MGRSKNPNPKRHRSAAAGRDFDTSRNDDAQCEIISIQGQEQQQQQHPGNNHHDELIANSHDESRIYHVAVGPNLTIPLSVKRQDRKRITTQSNPSASGLKKRRIEPRDDRHEDIVQQDEKENQNQNNSHSPTTITETTATNTTPPKTTNSSAPEVVILKRTDNSNVIQIELHPIPLLFQNRNNNNNTNIKIKNYARSEHIQRQYKHDEMVRKGPRWKQLQTFHFLDTVEIMPQENNGQASSFYSAHVIEMMQQNNQQEKHDNHEKEQDYAVPSPLSSFYYTLRTAQGVETLFQQLQLPHSSHLFIKEQDEQENNTTNDTTTATNDPPSMAAILGNAVEDGTVIINLCWTNQTTTCQEQKGKSPHVELWLTRKALHLCHPTVLPKESLMQARRRQQRQWNNNKGPCDLPAFYLHQIMARLFSDTTNTSTAVSFLQSTAFPITNPSLLSAKSVYNVLDNIQLQNAQQQQEQQQSAQSLDQPLVIPGLVPTLRPYQEAAVKWMLRRECADECALHNDPDTSNSGDNTKPNNSASNEWMMAWIVIILGNQPADVTLTKNNHSVGVQSLLDYCRRVNHKDEDNIFLYCPLTGWVAQTIPEAQAAMVLDPNQHHDGLAQTDSRQNNVSCRGGILAESMGLGKTVECIACILAHPMKTATATATATMTTRAATETGNADNENKTEMNVIAPGFETPFAKVNQDNSRSSPPAAASIQTSHPNDQRMLDRHNHNKKENHDGPSARKRLFASSSDEKNDNDEKRAKIDNTVCPQTNELPNPVTPDDRSFKNEKLTKKTGKTSRSNCLMEPSLEDGICICGRPDLFKGCLSFVLCKQCREPMHGVCAGFSSLEELLEQTELVIVSDETSSSTTTSKTKRAKKKQIVKRYCQPSHCPSCVFANNKLLPSRATVIVTPPSIMNQWEREIRRHTAIPVQSGAPKQDDDNDNDGQVGTPNNNNNNKRPLKVIVYPGVRNIFRRYSQKRRLSLLEENNRPECHLIHPRVLADADIVLMTFDALMGDLGYSNDNPFIYSQNNNSKHNGMWQKQKSLRARKRYRVIPSPLLSIDWWRVCLDEAQRVETPTATCAQMALKLHARHRWCITGTPIGKGKLDDLYGLLLFLRMEPFSSLFWFQHCLDPRYGGVLDRVKQLFGNVLWRSTKANEMVREQMGVPVQVEKKIMLSFSSIEKHFYERQLEQTILAASDINNNNNNAANHRRRLKSSTRKLNVLSMQLHRLRAACCHPQVGSSGLGRNNKRKRLVNGTSLEPTSRVLSMDQILDRFIDDCKIQCEEAQRLAVMHTNAMAALSRLKVEAKQLRLEGVQFKDSDCELMAQSCELFMESLNLAERNSTPSSLVGESLVTGCQGFQTATGDAGATNATDAALGTPGGLTVRNGKTNLQWILRTPDTKTLRDVWARFDFEGPAKKVCEIRMKPIVEIPQNLQAAESGWKIVYPQECTFQVSHSALGGEFVNVTSFSLDGNDWQTFGGFRTNRSKAWRLVVKSFRDNDDQDGTTQDKTTAKKKDDGDDVHKYFVGVEIELKEPDVASDSLQRLHVLHNASLSLSSLQQIVITKEDDAAAKEDNDDNMYETRLKIPKNQVSDRIVEMQEECKTIESLYMDGARALHAEILRELDQASLLRSDAEDELTKASKRAGGKSPKDVWDDVWWDDFLSTLFVHGNPEEREQLCVRVQTDIENFSQSITANEIKNKRNATRVGFPSFYDVDRLHNALNTRISHLVDVVGGGAHEQCMKKVSAFSEHPSESETIENSQCGTCHADWNQTGPECRHCKLEKELLKLEPDGLILCILKAMGKYLRDAKPSNGVNMCFNELNLRKRSDLFFSVVKKREREWQTAKKAWRIHLDLLNDFDEVNQCKRSMRLLRQDEDMTKFTNDELNALVLPCDIAARYMDHNAKQAMSLAQLRRHMHTLRYLKNQNKERQAERKNEDKDDKKNGEEEEETQCVVCLSALGGERAVLSCGHSFHQACLERLTGGLNGQAMVTCPLRCSKRTRKDDVLIASERRKDDGSKGTRHVEGSFGTKVTRLMGDLMDVADLGEKSVVFSQWEDMLEVVEQALVTNRVGYVRVKNLSKIGEAMKRFRSMDCSVLLLNVKNGAEGLTLVEATHVFMIEPLLNCGLDSQAINRIHRIGQTSRTYVHRYLIEGTIEIKIDKLRMERQEDQLEDSINEVKRKKFDVSGGGIDGGFTHAELQDLFKEE